MAIDVYFNDIHKVIIEQIKHAQQEILIAVAWLKDRDIYQALIERAQQKIKIEIILANHEFNKNNDYSDTALKKLINLGSEIFYIGENGDHRRSNLMHHKFCIIDKNTVINGSYNWTFKARYNHENIMLAKNETEFSNKFLQEFEKIRPNSQLKINEHNQLIKVDIQAIVAKFSQLNSATEVNNTTSANICDVNDTIAKFNF